MSVNQLDGSTSAIQPEDYPGTRISASRTTARYYSEREFRHLAMRYTRPLSMVRREVQRLTEKKEIV